ncbi:MAG: TolC family protein [Gemmatimonadales bacterium]
MLARGIAACAAALVVLTAPVARAQAPGITLADALRRAAELNPDIRTAEAEVAAARGGLRGARLLTYNVELLGGLGRVTGADTSFTGYEIGLSQRFELGGKRGWRIRAAEQRVTAAEARLARRREEVAARVSRTFLLGLIARMRSGAAREGEQVAAQLRSAADERLALGAGTQLEVNVATASASRERRARLEAERAYASSVIDLASAIGLPPTELAEPEGEPTLPPADTRTETELVAAALERRADLRAAVAEREAAGADFGFARGLAWPDPAIGAALSREDNRFWQVTVSLPLPLWNRGQGARAEARAGLERARIAEAALRRQVELEVRDAYQAYQRAREAQAGFDRDLVERLAENLQLAEESFRAGKIGLLIFNTVRRDLVEGQLAYLDALGDVVERQAVLQLAIGDTGGSVNER